MRFLIIFLALLPAFAFAGVINRCFNARTGQTVFIDTPCPDGTSPRGAIPFQDRSSAELESERQLERLKAQTLIESQRFNQVYPDNGGPSVTQTGGSKCARLKESRDYWCNREDSAGRSYCTDTLYAYNKSCR